MDEARFLALALTNPINVAIIDELDKHGLPYPPLTCSTDGIDHFLTQNTQVGIRRRGEGYDVYARHGFDDIAGPIVRPNPGPNFPRRITR